MQEIPISNPSSEEIDSSHEDHSVMAMRCLFGPPSSFAQVIIAAIYKCNKRLGCAYYDAEESRIFVMQESLDEENEILKLCMLNGIDIVSSKSQNVLVLLHIEPVAIITSSSLDTKFIDILKGKYSKD
jgi:hypothetical protein